MSIVEQTQEPVSAAELAKGIEPKAEKSNEFDAQHPEVIKSLMLAQGEARRNMSRRLATR